MSEGEGQKLSYTVRFCRQRLEDYGIEPTDALIESLILLQHITGLTTEEIIGNPDRLVDEADIVDFLGLMFRRCAREPLAYILGETEFYGRKFHVGRGVLIPRPETEALVALALDFASEHAMVSPRVCDLGTGSGVLAVSVASELAQCEVIACDISDDALKVAASNAARYDVAGRIDFRNADMTSESIGDVLGRFDIVVANPPYIPTGRLENKLEPEVSKWEPRLALDGGPDGMKVLGPVIERIPMLMRECGPSLALIEIDHASAGMCLDMATRANPDATCKIIRDLARLNRILSIERRAPTMAA